MKKLLTKLAIVGSGTVMFAGAALANTSTLGLGDVGNSGTGFNSVNVAELEVESETLVVNENTYRVTNDIDAYLKTGNNLITKSNHFGGGWSWNDHEWSFSSAMLGESGIQTGDASATVRVTNSGNSNENDVSGNMSFSLPSVVNSTTGANSENRASAEVSNEIKVINKNSACVNNDIDVTASTGNNTSSYNTGGSSISTGDASISISVDNNLNSNSTTVQ